VIDPFYPDYEAAIGHQKLVKRLYNRFGVRVTYRELLPEGVVYTAGRVALAADSLRPELALHDLSHYIVSASDLRDKPNFGLGPAPHVGESVAVEPRLDSDEVDDEEGIASAYNVLLARRVFGTAAARSVATLLSALHYKDTDEEISDQIRIVARGETPDHNINQLIKRGVIDTGLNITWRLNTLDVRHCTGKAKDTSWAT
jgi:hypothetical protein